MQKKSHWTVPAPALLSSPMQPSAKAPQQSLTVAGGQGVRILAAPPESQTKSAWRTAAELYRADSAVRGAASQRKAKSGPANDRIAGGFDDPPAMLRDERIGGCAMLTLCLRRALVVRPPQPRITATSAARIAVCRRVALIRRRATASVDPVGAQ